MKYDSYSQNQENSACDCESQTPEKEIVYQEVSDPYADIKNQWFTRYRQYMQAIAWRFDSYGFIWEGEMNRAHIPFGFEYENPFFGFVWQDYQEQYMYFFPGMSFQELQEIYTNIGQQTEAFSINTIDYIADRAFFLNGTSQDGMVRLIIQKDENIFWLMMKKEYYDDIREMVQKF